jgi:hypothetical protein
VQALRAARSISLWLFLAVAVSIIQQSGPGPDPGSLIVVKNAVNACLGGEAVVKRAYNVPAVSCN